MRTRIRRWGNSLALRIPRAHAADLGWADGTEVDLGADGDRLDVRTAGPAAPSLAGLVEAISPFNLPAGADATAPDSPVPDCGDLVRLEGPDGPVACLILSPAAYNARTGVALACPVATRIKGYPFEVILDVGGRTVGAALCDRVETVAWRERRAERVGRAPAAAVREASARLQALLPRR